MGGKCIEFGHAMGVAGGAVDSVQHLGRFAAIQLCSDAQLVWML